MKAEQQHQLKDFSRNLKELCSRYKIHYKGKSSMRQSEPISYKAWTDNIYNDDYIRSYLQTYEVPAVDITISERDLNSLMNDLAETTTGDYSEYCQMKRVLGDHFLLDLHVYKSQQAREERARKENPGVQKAWENYQLMLKLAGG